MLGRLLKMTSGASFSRFAYSRTRSTDTILVSTSTVWRTIQFRDCVICKAYDICDRISTFSVLRPCSGHPRVTPACCTIQPKGGRRRRKTYREAHHASRKSTACRDRDDGKYCRSKDNDTPNEFQSHSQPPVRANAGKISPQVGVHPPLILQGESRLLSVGANGAHAAQAFLEMSINGRARDTVQALQLT